MRSRIFFFTGEHSLAYGPTQFKDIKHLPHNLGASALKFFANDGSTVCSKGVELVAKQIDHVCNVPVVTTNISVRDEVRSGGLKSPCPNISFHCLHVNKVVFARILPDFLPEYGYLKNSRGAIAPLSPMGPYAYDDQYIL